MMPLLKFLFATFSNKEGATRASAATVAAVGAGWFLFTPLIAFNAFKAGQDHQNKLMWKDHALIRDALQHAGIFVPTLTDDVAAPNPPKLDGN
jgi:hypothetical protein